MASNPLCSRFFRYNGLSLVILALFLLTFAGQWIAGRAEFNDEQRSYGLPEISFLDYGRSGHFWGAVAENWESEFLQMALFVLLTVFLYQKGSPESKDPDGDNPEDEDPAGHANDPKAPWAVKRGGWVLWLYSHSLGITFGLIFVLSFMMHVFAGHRAYGREQALAGQPYPTVGEYATSGRFWFESMQNWQSEFLSLGAMVYVSVFLREKGSAESKPVATPYDEKE